MGGLRRATLSEAMEVLQDKNLQIYLYFKNNKQFSRVIDYEWIFNHNKRTSLLNQTFYMELDMIPKKDNISIQTEENLKNNCQTINIMINVPLEDIQHKDRREVVKGVLAACEYHLLQQLREEK